MLRIFTDFDGPIMDVSERYYRVYQFCLEQIKRPDQPISVLSKEEFWKLKRSRVPERQIGILSGLDEAQAPEFSQLRRDTVHTLPYLVHDKPVPGAIATLEKLHRANVDLAIMTMRRTRELEIPFKDHNLQRFFKTDRCYCLPNDYIKTGDVKDKPLLMERALKELSPATENWAIGDTEADIVAAKTNNVHAIGVLSGIRDRAQLEQYNPDFIVANLTDAIALIEEQSSLPLVG
ncbi:HAD family hydrolase [Lusitaniella coriacea LEGE 07157]|uniref:HAD family hydrolase n=1 Tax=Lusitaniella coriacea LEGE 07157 TaxID=945747 RepID=A0A8J7JBW9_9CYAN|nr:HAD family hydrolase [Lusitaniella coriacea]MBE9117060.1 HAD family hydrolase [Lusitaniella coriacea LEGE 07157]